MPKLLQLILFSLLIFSCSSEKKNTTANSSTQVNNELSKYSPSNNSKNLLQAVTASFQPDMVFVKSRIEHFKQNKDEDRDPDVEEVTVKLLTMAMESYEKKEYQNCISKAAQIPLSNPLFSPAQYLVAFSFLHTKSYERAVEIFKGMSQNQDFFKEINREEAAAMHVLSQYHFYKKTKNDFQKKELTEAVKYFISKYPNNSSTNGILVKDIKEEMKI